jgi:hypothetical protein
MLLPTLVFVLVIVTALLFFWFSSLPKSSVWKVALFLSLGIAVVRTFSSLAGRLILTNESNWTQIPAFALALASLPEAAFAQRLHELTVASSVSLGLLILLGTSIWVFGIAAAAYRRKR